MASSTHGGALGESRVYSRAPRASSTHSWSPRCSVMMPALDADPAHLLLVTPTDVMSALP